MGTCITVFPTTDQTHIIFCLIELKLIENLVSIKKMMHIINDMQDKLYASTKSYCIYTVFNRGTESASGTPLGQSSATSVLIRSAIQGAKQEASDTKRLQQLWFHGQQSKCFCSYPQWNAWRSPSPDSDQSLLLPTATASNPSLMRMSLSTPSCVPPPTPRSVTLSLSPNLLSRFASLTTNASVCHCH